MRWKRSSGSCNRRGVIDSDSFIYVLYFAALIIFAVLFPFSQKEFDHYDADYEPVRWMSDAKYYWMEGNINHHQDGSNEDA